MSVGELGSGVTSRWRELKCIMAPEENGLSNLMGGWFRGSVICWKLMVGVMGEEHFCLYKVSMYV